MSLDLNHLAITFPPTAPGDIPTPPAGTATQFIGLDGYAYVKDSTGTVKPVAARDDGVSTVNGVTPDGSGNVVVTTSNISYSPGVTATTAITEAKAAGESAGQEAGEAAAAAQVANNLAVSAQDLAGTANQTASEALELAEGALPAESATGELFRDKLEELSDDDRLPVDSVKGATKFSGGELTDGSSSYKLYTGASQNGIGVNLRDFTELATEADMTTDHTAAFLAACAAAGAGGTVFIPQGFLNLKGPESGTAGIATIACSLVGVRGETTVRYTNADGRRNRLYYYNQTNIRVENITFYTVNWPANVSNGAQEFDSTFLFLECRNVEISNCTFLRQFGTAVLFRSCRDAWVRKCWFEDAWKDQTHFTALCVDCGVEKSTYVNCGDDAVAVVGYATGNPSTGRPRNTQISSINVYGVKLARAVTVIGADGCVIRDLYVDGLMPAGKPTSDAWNAANKLSDVPDGMYTTKAGLLLGGEYTPGYTTFGSDDILVENFKIKNCGHVTMGAVHISATNITGGQNNNITLKRGKIERSARWGLAITGDGFTNNPRLVDIDILETTDPNDRRTKTLSAKDGSGLELIRANGLIAENIRIFDVGGSAIFIDQYNTGDFKLVWKAARVNKSGAATKYALRVLEATAPNIRLDNQLELVEQAEVTSGNPYYIQYVMQIASMGGRIVRNVVESKNFSRPYISPTSSVATGAASATAWINDNLFPVNINVSAATKIERSFAQGIAEANVKWSDIVGRTSGYFTLTPGEGMRVTFTGTPTITWKPVTE